MAQLHDGAGFSVGLYGSLGGGIMGGGIRFTLHAFPR